MKKIVLLAMATLMSASVDAQKLAVLHDSTQVENSLRWWYAVCVRRRKCTLRRE